MKKLIGFLLLSVLSFLSFAPAALAKGSMQSGNRIILEKNEVVDGNYFAGGESVLLSGIVSGDAYVAGNSVVVEGTVKGDLLVAGSDLDIRGTVTGDIRAIAGNITISGKVGGNLTLGAGKVLIADSAALGGSIVAGAGDLNIAAPVGKGITAGVGRLYLADKVGGDLDYWSEEELVMSGDATVSGTLTRHAVPKSEKRPQQLAAGAVAGVALGFKLIEMLGLLLIGVIMLRVIPLYTAGVITEINKKPWLSLLIGFIALIMVPVTILVLLTTIIGIPLALVGALAFLLLLTFAKIFAALFLGIKVVGYFAKSPSPYASLTVGFVLYYALFLVPVLGWLAVAVLYLMAVGGLALHRKSFYDSLRTKKLI